MKRLMNISYQMLQPDQVIGLQTGVFSRGYGTAQRGCLRSYIGNRGRGNRRVIPTESGIDEVPVAMAFTVAESNVNFNSPPTDGTSESVSHLCLMLSAHVAALMKR